MKRLFFLLTLLACVFGTSAQTTYKWDGSVSADWNVGANWIPNGIPAAGDKVMIGPAPHDCTLNEDKTIGKLFITNGTLDLNTYHIIITGDTSIITESEIKNGDLTITGALHTNLYSSVGSNLMDCKTDITTEFIYLRKNVFNKEFTLLKTGSSSSGLYGNNIYNGPVSFTNTGSGYVIFSQNESDIFNDAAVFTNTGSGNVYIADSGPNNEFNGTVTINNHSISNAQMVIGRNVPSITFEHDIIVSSSEGGIEFKGATPGASFILADGATLKVETGNFTGGKLTINNFKQIGITPFQITTTGTSQVSLISNNSFEGPVQITVPHIDMKQNLFHDAVVLTKTDGTISSATHGGNVFNSTFTVNYFSSTGSGYISFGYIDPDEYNCDVYANNNSKDRIIFGHKSVNNQFNGDLYVSQTGSSVGTALTWDPGSESVFALGRTIKIGTGGFDAGYLYVQGVDQHGAAPMNLITSGNTSVYIGNANPSKIGGELNIEAANIYFRGAVLKSPVTITKTGGSSNHNSGKQNIFKSTLTINQRSTSGYFMLGYKSNDIFEDDIYVSNTGTQNIYLGYSSGMDFPVLSAGKTIRVGAEGFSSGTLQLSHFTQLGNEPMDLLFSGNSTVYFNYGSRIGGDLKVTAARIYFDGCTFDGTVHAEKIGSMAANSAGGNLFNKEVKLISKGTGELHYGRILPDVFNDDVYIKNESSSTMNFGYNTANNMFNGDIYVSSLGGSKGINFSNTVGATSFLAAGKTIFIGVEGFSKGLLSLAGFTQQGNEPVSLALSDEAEFAVKQSCLIGGPVDVTAGRIFINNSRFLREVTLTKTGVVGETSNGGNIFEGVTTFNHLGGGSWTFGNTEPDIFNDDAYINNNSTHNFFLAHNATGNEFNGNLILSQTGNSLGINIGTGTAAGVTMAAGKSITTGTAGFDVGKLYLSRFKQLGNSPNYLPLTGTSSIFYGPSSEFGGDLTSTSWEVQFNRSIFKGRVDVTKLGSVNNQSPGGNQFNGVTTLTNSGTGYWLLAATEGDYFGDTLTVNNVGGHIFYLAYSSTNNIFDKPVFLNNMPTSASAGIQVSNGSVGTVFNDHITVNSNFGQGVLFNLGGTASDVTLAAGKTISVGAAGFSAGRLLLKDFTQLGPATQNLLLSDQAVLEINNSVIEGPFNSESGSIIFEHSTFKSPVSFSKTGDVNDQSTGVNVFEDDLVISNSGKGYIRVAHSNPDVYKKNITIKNSGIGTIYPNYGGTCDYQNDITVDANKQIYFGAGSGVAVMKGNVGQNINATAGTPVPQFRTFVVNNTGAGVTLNSTSINITEKMTLLNGLVHTSSTNILTMMSNSEVDAGNTLSTSYVNGPMQYQKASTGLSTMNFPVGAGADCRPVILSANHKNSTAYVYRTQVINDDAQALGYALPVTINRVSGVRYFKIDRFDVSGNSKPAENLSGVQTVTLSFDENDVVTDGSMLTIAKTTETAPNEWIDIGGAGGPAYDGGNNLVGTVTSTSAPTPFNSYSLFSIANRSPGMNILPAQLLYFKGKANDNREVHLSWSTVNESGNSIFVVEKSSDGVRFNDWQHVASQAAAGQSALPLNYFIIDDVPYSGTNYYRLKQISMDGTVTIHQVVAVNISGKLSVSFFPNPATQYVRVKGLTSTGKPLKAVWYDVSGRIVKTDRMNPGNGEVQLAAPAFSGMYILRIVSAEGIVWEEKIYVERK